MILARKKRCDWSLRLMKKLSNQSYYRVFDEIVPRFIILCKSKEEDKEALFLSQVNPNESFIQDNYKIKLDRWRNENEDPSKMNILDFFKDKTKFDVLEINNFIGQSIVDKSISHIERHPSFKLFQKPSSIEVDKKVDVFQKMTSEDDKVGLLEVRIVIWKVKQVELCLQRVTQSRDSFKGKREQQTDESF